MPEADRAVAAAVGRAVLAPLLSAHAAAAARWLDRVPSLHGVALRRDGTLLGLATQRLAPHLTPRLGQAWLGRQQVAAAAIDGAADHENLLNLLARMRRRPALWGEAADMLALPPPPRPDLPLGVPSPPAFWDWLARPAIDARLRQRCDQVRRRLLAHLDAAIPATAPLMLLDVGYAGTVQRCLKRIHRLAGRPRPIHGLYLLTSPGIAWAKPGPGTIRTVLAGPERQPLAAATLLRHRDVLECLLAESAGELLDYGDDGTPVTAPPPADDERRRLQGHLHASALDAVAPGISARRARAALLDFLLGPDAATARLIGDWRHADQSALDGCRRLADGPPDGDRDQTLWPAAAALRQRAPGGGLG